MFLSMVLFLVDLKSTVKECMYLCDKAWIGIISSC
jgi:hypothetical protein